MHSQIPLIWKLIFWKSWYSAFEEDSWKSWSFGISNLHCVSWALWYHL